MAENKKIKIDDSAIINVRSNTHGKLTYVNHRTGDKYVWGQFGDIQQMTMADLRAMKSNQVGFFANNRIMVTGIESEGYENARPADVYRALFVDRYYKNMLVPTNRFELCKWSVGTIKARVAAMTPALKDSLVITLRAMIANGELDSMKQIRNFELALECELQEA